MNVTLSVIKADVGSIGGHTRPSERMLQTVRMPRLARHADHARRPLQALAAHHVDFTLPITDIGPTLVGLVEGSLADDVEDGARERRK